MKPYYYELIYNGRTIGAIEVTGTGDGDPWDEIKEYYPMCYDWLDSAGECRVGDLIDESVAICLGILSDDYEILRVIESMQEVE